MIISSSAVCGVWVYQLGAERKLYTVSFASYLVLLQPLQSVIAGHHEEDERPFYVLSGTQLNKWVVGDYNMERVSVFSLNVTLVICFYTCSKHRDKTVVQLNFKQCLLSPF